MWRTFTTCFYDKEYFMLLIFLQLCNSFLANTCLMLAAKTLYYFLSPRHCSFVFVVNLDHYLLSVILIFLLYVITISVIYRFIFFTVFITSVVIIISFFCFVYFCFLLGYLLSTLFVSSTDGCLFIYCMSFSL